MHQDTPKAMAIGGGMSRTANGLIQGTATVATMAQHRSKEGTGTSKEIGWMGGGMSKASG
jgi:hypothetical protein